MSPSSQPQLIFGAASFGDKFVDGDQVQSVLNLLKSRGIARLDTAGRYPSFKAGRSEELIGETKAAEQGFEVDTKILAITSDHKGDLTKENIEKSLSASLQRLKISKVNTLHIHVPDPHTPVKEQAGALNELWKQGKFGKLGVSNFTASELETFLDVCDENNFVKPTVYQGDYSLVNRGMEKHLLPILRKHGIVFNAFRVIASGFLSGNLTGGATEGTRFSGDTPTAKYMNQLYDNEALHQAQRKLAEAIEPLQISPVEAALRWAMYHSALQQGDGVILGASKEAQIQSNVEAVSRGPLAQNVVEAIENIWDGLKGEREDKYIS